MNILNEKKMSKITYSCDSRHQSNWKDIGSRNRLVGRCMLRLVHTKFLCSQRYRDRSSFRWNRVDKYIDIRSHCRCTMRRFDTRQLRKHRIHTDNRRRWNRRHKYNSSPSQSHDTCRRACTDCRCIVLVPFRIVFHQFRLGTHRKSLGTSRCNWRHFCTDVEWNRFRFPFRNCHRPSRLRRHIRTSRYDQCIFRHSNMADIHSRRCSSRTLRRCSRRDIHTRIYCPNRCNAQCRPDCMDRSSIRQFLLRIASQRSPDDICMQNHRSRRCKLLRFGMDHSRNRRSDADNSCRCSLADSCTYNHRLNQYNFHHLRMDFQHNRWYQCRNCVLPIHCYKRIRSWTDDRRTHHDDTVLTNINRSSLGNVFR